MHKANLNARSILPYYLLLIGPQIGQKIAEKGTNLTISEVKFFSYHYVQHSLILTFTVLNIFYQVICAYIITTMCLDAFRAISHNLTDRKEIKYRHTLPG